MNRTKKELLEEIEVLNRELMRDKGRLKQITLDFEEKMKYEAIIKQSRENYRRLVNDIPEAIIVHCDNKIVFANSKAMDLIDESDFSKFHQKSILDFVDPKYLPKIKERIGRVLKGKEVPFTEITIKTEKGKNKEVETKGILTTYKDKPAILVLLRDITEKKELEREKLHSHVVEEINIELKKEIKERLLVEKTLTETQKTNNALLLAIPDVMFTTTKDGSFIDFIRTKERDRIPGLGKGKVLGKKIKNVLPAKVAKMMNANIRIAIRTEKRQSFEYQINDDKDQGKLKDFEARIIKVNSNEALVMLRDIEERKRAEEELQRSLDEKEILLKEIHHRVKNNLQIISSLLSLQSSYLEDEESINLIKDSQNRVKSMAFIHEILYQRKNFSQVDFSEYVNNLVSNLIFSYAPSGTHIDLTLKVDPVFMDLDNAIPCGLIINELVSNSLKHAFSKLDKEKHLILDFKGAKLFVGLKKMKKEQLELIVADNGKGISKKSDIKNSDSLGLQLVNTLVEQLDGKIEVDLSKGTKFIITFSQ